MTRWLASLNLDLKKLLKILEAMSQIIKPLSADSTTIRVEERSLLFLFDPFNSLSTHHFDSAKRHNRNLYNYVLSIIPKMSAKA